MGGLRATGRPGEDHAAVRLATLRDASQPVAQHVPVTFPTYYRLQRNEPTAGARVVYAVEDNPVLTLNTAEGKRVVMWDPPDVMFKEKASLAEDWGGSGAPYALVAGALNALLSGDEILHAEAIDLDQTMNVTAWRGSDGVVRILAGNLEEGLRDDAEMIRHIVLVIPKSWLATSWTDAWTQQKFETDHGRLKINLGQADSILLRSAMPNESH
jgi:hypothetical protein